MGDKKVSEIFSEIDKFVITACVTLLAAFAVIFSINKNSILVTYLVSICSIFFLLITLLFSLWHMYRSFLRKKIYDKNHEKWIQESTDVLKEMFDNAKEAAKLDIKNYVLENTTEFQDKSKEEILNILDGKFPAEKYTTKNEKMIEAVAYAIFTKRNECHKNAFGPLEERGATFKWVLDNLAQKFRYHFFVAGLLTFFVALSLKLLY